MSGVSSPSFGRRLMLCMAAVSAFTAYPLYRFGVILIVELGKQRALGTWAGCMLVLVLAALVLAVVTRPWTPGERARRWLRIGLFFAFLCNGALIGGAVFAQHIWLIPKTHLALGALVVIALTLAYIRQPDEDQAPLARLLVTLVLMIYTVPLVTSPWVAYGAWQDAHALAGEKPEIVVAGPLPTAPRRIVVLVSDAMRRRSTSLDPAGAGRTPNVAKLAATSTDFLRAHAPTDATLLSVPIALSGQGPEVVCHQTLVKETAFFREGSLTSVAAYLRPAGYRAYYSTMLLTMRIFGMERDFDQGYANAYGFLTDDNRFNTRSYLPVWTALTWLLYRPFGGIEKELPKPTSLVEVLGRASEFYERPDERSIVWVHVGMPHQPYYTITKDPATGRLVPSTEGKIEFDDIRLGMAKDVHHNEAMYHANVAYMDQELGTFLDRLKANPLWKDTMVVFTADHGTDFRAGLPTHGTGDMTERLTHIPLLIHAPGQAAPAKDDRLASLLDLTPTLLARAYKQPAPLQGIDLLGPDKPDRMIASYGLYGSYAGDSPVHRAIAAYTGHHKFLLRFPGHLESLYDMATDPGCEHDIAPREPALAGRMRDWIETKYTPPAK